MLAAQIYDAKLLQKFGGFVQGQYYFNNQWFVNALYGVSKAYGVTRSRFNCRRASMVNPVSMAWSGPWVIMPRRSSRPA